MAAATSNSVVLLYSSLLFFFALYCGGGALGTVQGRRSPAGKWPILMHAKNNASGNISPIKPMDTSDSVLHIALFRSNMAEYYGAKAVFTVHPLRDLHGGQESSAIVSMANTDQMDAIGAGWHVSPDLYGDNQVHFFTFWTADSYHDTGCFDLRCPGFVVKVGSPIIPGSILASVRQMTIIIRKDSPLDDWHLYVDDGFIEAEVGRWPSTLFTRLNANANSIVFGGHVEFSKGDIGPPMGSGHFSGDVGASAAVKKLQFFDSHGSPINFELGTIDADARECYDAVLTPHTSTRLGGDGGLTFFYGGPSGCKN